MWLKENFSFNHCIINGYEWQHTNTILQGNQPCKQESTVKGIHAVGASEKGNLENMVSHLRQELDDHSLIIALQREMHSSNQRNT